MPGAKRPRIPQLGVGLVVVTLLAIHVQPLQAAQLNNVQYGGGCPNMCSGHGYCDYPQNENCTCMEGWSAPDCSWRTCPSSYAWADYATAADTAHAAFTECSAMGICDRATGICTCRSGFTGEACQRMVCPGNGNCNGNGRCISERDAAQQADFVDLFYYNETYTEWDADMIFGCACDAGWTGYDCSLRSCPYSSDPYAEYLSPGVDELQLLDCTCLSTCSGSLLLTFLGHTTQAIPWDATAELVKFRLEQLPTVTEVSVSFSPSTSLLCSAAGTTASISFTKQAGSLVTMALDDSYLLSSSGTAPDVALFVDGAQSLVSSLYSADGTKTYEECSGRGYCNPATGVCECYSNYYSSDGAGNAGAMGDCGYIDLTDLPTTCPSAVGIYGTVTVLNSTAVCTGNGVCDATTLQCDCDATHTGWACEMLNCYSNLAYFDEPVGGTAHTTNATCSNAGICDHTTGECTCWENMFNGTDCSQLKCPTDCNDHGACSTMRELALVAKDNGELTPWSYTKWDADIITTCMCNRTNAVNNYYSGSSDTYRGPYAYAETNWLGYDCSLAGCPTGDDVLTDGVNEIQYVVCVGGFGVFTFTFRDHTSSELQFDATAAEIQAALEAMPMTGTVLVTMNGDDNACNAAVPGFWIEFLSVYGALPYIQANYAELYLTSAASAAGSMVVTRTQTGTKEDVECAHHGICQETTGVCQCFPGWQSSNGTRTDNYFYGGGGRAYVGQRGDCAWRNDMQTTLYHASGQAYGYS